MTVLQAISAAEREAAAKRGHAMPDGSFPIRNRTELESAIKLNGSSKTYSRGRIRAHIKRRAAALGLSSLIPEEWSVSQETPVVDPALVQDPPLLQATLMMEQIAKPVIIQDATLPEGVMRIKAPFYVGNSVSRAPGFQKRIVWQDKVLPHTIAEAKSKIASGQEILTSYARHADALAGNDLPIGRIVDVEQEGSVGYATLDVFPVKPRGEHAQTLLRAGALTAMSLRSTEYSLTNGKLDREEVLLCESLSLKGLDFAPDGPAQPTYGIQILSQEAVIMPDPEPAPPPVPEPEPGPPIPVARKETKLPDPTQPITLEALRSDAPDVVEQIEAPLRQRLLALESENKKLVEANELRGRDAAIQTYAAKTGNPADFARILTELCQEQKITTEAGVGAVVAPLLMQELERRAAAPVEPQKTKQEQLLELFGAGANGAGRGAVTQEPPATPTSDPGITQEQNARGVTVGGLYEPEDL
jgi:hypothetical protein